MSSLSRTIGRTLPLTLLALACRDPTSARPRTAEFVLRSIGGEAVPATILIGGEARLVLAETLFVDPPRAADGTGVLRRSLAEAPAAAVPQVQRGIHKFIWRDPDLSVFFACQAQQPCLAIYTYRHGTLSGHDLRFPASGPFVPERLYERVR